MEMEVFEMQFLIIKIFKKLYCSLCHSVQSAMVAMVEL